MNDNDNDNDNNNDNNIINVNIINSLLFANYHPCGWKTQVVAPMVSTFHLGKSEGLKVGTPQIRQFSLVDFP